MDCGSAMSRGHNGVKNYFEESFSHNLYLHYRDKQVASFCHLILKYNKFKQFDGLLFNLWLILKKRPVRQSIFDEVEKAYELKSLKLIKAAFTCCSAMIVLYKECFTIRSL